VAARRNSSSAARRSHAPAPAFVSGPAPLLRMSGIVKRFPGVTANDGAELSVERGEIHALLGENGAGKTTLMNVLYGIQQPDEGVIELGGRGVTLSSPRDALEHGIGMVHQHFMLVPDMTVTENVALGLQPGIIRRSELAQVRTRISAISEQFGLVVDPDAVVEDLSVGEQQRLEILKLLYRGAELLILDEPTAALTPPEWLQLAEVLRSLTAEGKAIVLITHKLDEVFHAADRCTVLRDGRTVGVVQVDASDKPSLARLMVGREVQLRTERQLLKPGSVVLAVRELTCESGGRGALRGVSLEVREREVLGVAGVDGNGQRELVEVLTGLRPSTGGQVEICGRQVQRLTPAAFMRAGGAVIPEDRHRDGAAAGLSVLDNLMMKDFDRPPFARRGVLDLGAAREHCLHLVEAYGIRTSGLDVRMRQLSGGNQQKSIVARELHRRPRLLIAAQPTRGLDVGAMEFVYKQIARHKAGGGGTLLISAELDEILSLSDRIAVIYEGRILATVAAEVAEPEVLGMLMAGQGSGHE
jgi:ABC-type uncharacterized transport system ATPase subunit